MDNGAALFIEQIAIKYLYKMDPLMDMPNIHVAAETLGD